MSRAVAVACLGFITLCSSLVGASSLPTSVSAAAELSAFPGAEGFGAGATGGRGGRVVLVTTLEPFGPGSLGEALAPSVCEPRIVVFRVSGVIEVPGKHDLELTCGNLTVAGQTAPGAGITVHGRIDAYGADPGGNLILRHLRIRPPPLTASDDESTRARYDALLLSNNPGSIVDHLSLSWASDEIIDLYEGASDVTVQWTTIEESNPQPAEHGAPHNKGIIVGPDSPRVTIHHVLCAHHRDRCPAMAAGPGEVINSVIYDVRDAFVHHNPAAGEFHVLGNTFRAGPSSDRFTPLYFDDEDPGGTTYWLSQNEFQIPGVLEATVDDIADTPLADVAFAGAGPEAILPAGADFGALTAAYVPVVVQSPGDAYRAVLERAGAFPRDVVTLRTIEEVETLAGQWAARPPADLLEGLRPTAAPDDDDADGMADAWEAAHGLDSANPDDHRRVQPSGYAAIEEYINELADRLVGGRPGGPSASTTEAPRPAPNVTTPGIGASPGTMGPDVDTGRPAHAIVDLALILGIVLVTMVAGAFAWLTRRKARGG